MKPPYEAMQLNGNVCTSFFFFLQKERKKKKSFHISDIRLILQLSRGDPVWLTGYYNPSTNCSYNYRANNMRQQVAPMIIMRNSMLKKPNSQQYKHNYIQLYLYQTGSCSLTQTIGDS